MINLENCFSFANPPLCLQLYLHFISIQILYYTLTIFIFFIFVIIMSYMFDFLRTMSQQVLNFAFHQVLHSNFWRMPQQRLSRLNLTVAGWRTASCSRLQFCIYNIKNKIVILTYNKKHFRKISPSPFPLPLKFPFL